jgi:hypothetical protein
MNIIEQEDIVKGLPDAALQMEMQMPSGQVPEFLVLSEIQRRTDMRQRYAAQEPMPTATVKDQVMAQGIAAAAAPLSPVPAGPGSSLPALPVGDAQQGLAGMGVPMMAKGGKTESDFPDYSGDGEITKKDILIGRGVIPMQDGGGLSEAAGRSRSNSPSRMAESFTGPTDFLVQAATSYLISQGLDPSTYTIQELVEIGRQRAQDRRSFLPASVADEQMGTLGEVLEGSKNLLASALPDMPEMPEMNLGASSADRQRRAGELADELSRRGSAISESFDLDVPVSQSDIDERNRQLELNRGIVSSDAVGNLLDQLSPERAAVGSSGQMRRGRSRADDERSSLADMLGNISNIFDPRQETEETSEVDTGDLTGEELAAQLIGIQSADEIAAEGAAIPTDTAETVQSIAQALGGGVDKDFRFYDVDLPNTNAGRSDAGRADDPLFDAQNQSASLAKTRAEDISELIETNRARTRNDALYAALGMMGAGIASGAPDLGIGKGTEVASKIMSESRGREDLLRTQKMAAEDKDLERQIDFIKTRANIDLNERKLAAEIAANKDLQSRNQATRQSAVANVVNNIYDANDYSDAEERKGAYVSLYNSLASAYSVPRLTVENAQAGTTKTPERSIGAFDL